MSIPPKVEDLKPTDEQLTKWKKNGIISDFQGKNLNISEKEGWKNNLVIKNCLELENFYCNNLISSRKLEGLAIENCPKLECLDASNNNLKIVRFKEVNNLEDVYLSNNKLTKFDASNLPNVKNLDVSANQLINLTLTKREKLVNLNCANNRLEKITDLGDCQSLQGLYCHNNPFYLNGLEVKKLTNLKYLYCQHCYILEADISDLEFLEHFVCYGKKFIGTVDKFRIDGLRSVKINNCKNLKVLDLGESCLEELLVSNCPTLFIVSVRQNSLKALIFLDCPKLYYVDFCRQIYPPISGVTFDKSVDEEVVKNYKFNFVHFSTELLIDNSPVLGEVYYAHNTTFCNNDGEKIDKDEWKRFYPRITVLEEKSSWENVNFDRVLDRMLLAE
ncbi:MAG: leucine-rich repeat domain-containing protein [Spiroplasmataceae bacterium]|nr:leucine-rich repeat domain-containing protein [Spiroplasmataceae bacterium]